MATKEIPINDLGFQSGKIFNDNYTHTSSNALSYTIYNPNPYAVDCLITIQAGSGEITYSDRETAGAVKTYYAGRQGNSIQAYIGYYASDRELFLYAAGGLGSQEAQSATRPWRGSTKGWGSWSGIAHSRQVAQNGEVRSCMRTLGAHKTLEIYYAEGYGSHKGNHSVSIVY